MTDMTVFPVILKAQDNLFSSFFYHSPVMQVITEPCNGRIMDVNDRFCCFYDYLREELVGKTLLEMNIMLNPHDREEIIARVLAEKSVHGMEILERTRCGEYKWISVSVNLLNLSGKECFLGIGIDITEKKRIETEMKKMNAELEAKIAERTYEMRSFTEYFHRAQEEERAHISREIHDELGQQLIGMKMGLASLKKNMAGDEKILAKITNMMEDVDGSIHSMKKIVTQLRPGILDTLGLIPSIEWLTREFQNKTGIACRFQLLPVQSEFNQKVSIGFFRICQEALNNIVKHADASEAVVLLGQQEDKLILKVSDNGKGIRSVKINNPFSMGITGMRERAAIIGGNLEITGEVTGTSVLLTVPVDENKNRV